MKWAFAGVLLVHSLIHLMGVAKGFGLAEMPQLTQPISRSMGVMWLLAALLGLATVIAFFAWPQGFWLLGLLTLAVSQTAIISAWGDAKFGSLANAILLVVVVHGFLTEGPFSFRAKFDDDAARGLARTIEAPILTEADLLALPDPVRRYLRATGFVGQPRVRNYRLRFAGRIRSAGDSAWMPFTADQQSFADEPTRLFLMRAKMFGLPVEAFHRLIGGAATMRVMAVGAIPIVDARGPEMDRSEAVTLLNDMCILAPGSLIEPTVAWEAVDARTARARFTNGAHSITATLFFDEAGLLSNFVSDDRLRSSPDGKTFTPLRFSTPISNYKAFGPFRLASHGEARWLLPEGELVYGEFELLDIAYNVIH